MALVHSSEISLQKTFVSGFRLAFLFQISRMKSNISFTLMMIQLRHVGPGRASIYTIHPMLGSVVTDWAPFLDPGPFVSHVLAQHALPISVYTALST